MIKRQELFKNISLNLIGGGLPILAAVVAIPLLINNIGVERFGALSLAWLIVGYFSLFDLGLGKSLTKAISEKLANNQKDSIPTLIWSGLITLTITGIICAIVLFGASKPLVFNILKISTSIQTETLYSMYILSLSIPLVTISSGLRGILEAYGRFGLVNIVKAPLGISNFLLPLFAAQFSPELHYIVITLIASRFLAFIIYLYFVTKCTHSYKHISFSAKETKVMLSFGGWLTISSVVWPLLLYLGRIFLGIFASLEAAAYFVTPYEIVTKLLLIPHAIITVLFPAFAQLFYKDSEQIKNLYTQALVTTFLLMSPLVLLIYNFAEEGLVLWINAELASNQNFNQSLKEYQSNDQKQT